MSVKVEGVHKWMRVIDDGAVVIRDKLSEAESFIAEMKAERDAKGYKL